jgi:hypothetical protein
MSANPRGSSEKSKTDAELSEGSPMRRWLMQRGISGVTAANSPEGFQRSRRVIGVDRQQQALRRKLQTDASPFKAYRTYPFQSARTSKKHGSTEVDSEDTTSSTSTTTKKSNKSKHSDSSKKTDKKKSSSKKDKHSSSNKLSKAL